MKIKYNPKSTGSNNDIIYLLDEPGSYLHSVAQERLCHMIKNISNKDGKVIYCTHTHHLLDPKYIPTKFIYIVQKDNNITIVDTEAAGIAYVCKMNSVDILILKGISDFPTDESLSTKELSHEEQYNIFIKNIPIIMNKIFDEYIKNVI